jgi:hypothetical protein
MIKRYDVNGHDVWIDEDATGEYVRYEDIEPLIDAIKDVLAVEGAPDTLRRLNQELEKVIA